MSDTAPVALRERVRAFWRDPDTYTRHTAVARLLGPVGRVLDVGGVPGRLAPLIPGAEIIVANLEPPADIVFDGEHLPLEKGTFDAAVSLDVIEHIPAPARAAHVRELERVARAAVIVCCPLGTPQHMALEASLDQWRRELTGAADPFLAEHLERGLPTEAELRALAAGGARFHYELRFQGDARAAAALFRAGARAGHHPTLRNRAVFVARRTLAVRRVRLRRFAHPYANRAFLAGRRLSVLSTAARASRRRPAPLP